jgi:hypothetical protein
LRWNVDFEPRQTNYSECSHTLKTFSQRLSEVGDKDKHWLDIKKAVPQIRIGLDQALSLAEGLVFFKYYWYGPKGRDLRHEIFSECQDSWISVHYGQSKMADNVITNFY